MSNTNELLPWPKLEDIKTALSSFTKDKLETSFLFLVRRLLAKEKALVAKMSDEAYRIIKNEYEGKGTMTKDRLATLCALPFLSPHLFELSMSILTPRARQVFSYVLEHGAATSGSLEKKFGITTSEIKAGSAGRGYYMSYYSNVRILEEFNILYGESTDYGREIVFHYPPEIRQLLLPMLNPAYRKIGKLRGQQELPAMPEGKTWHVFLGEEHILRELPGLVIHLNNKTIATSKKGRPNANAIKGVHKQMGLREFYPDTIQKDLLYLRSNMLVSILSQFDKMQVGGSAVALIKKTFDEFYTKHFTSTLHLLHYINKMGTISEYSHKKEEAVLKKLVFDNIPMGEWVSFAEFKERTMLQVVKLNPIGYDAHKLTVDWPKSYSNRDWDTELNVYPFHKDQLILWPLVRATIFLYAAWGLLDVVYEEPNCAVFGGTTDSPYDGLKYFRLNPLGAYVAGLAKDYVSNVQQPFTLELAADSLSVLLTDGDIELASKAIASFAKPVGPKRLQTNADLFLVNCTTAADLETKINLFRSIFTQQMPPNWEKFFKEISQKVNPLKELKHYAVFQLNPEDQALLQLIARDPDIKSLCIKAEGHRILVAEPDKARLKNLLRKHGYLAS